MYSVRDDTYSMSSPNIDYFPCIFEDPRAVFCKADLNFMIFFLLFSQRASPYPHRDTGWNAQWPFVRNQTYNRNLWSRPFLFYSILKDAIWTPDRWGDVSLYLLQGKPEGYRSEKNSVYPSNSTPVSHRCIFIDAGTKRWGQLFKA